VRKSHTIAALVFISVLLLSSCFAEKDPFYAGPYSGVQNIELNTSWWDSNDVFLRTDFEGSYSYGDEIACNLAQGEGDEVTLVLNFNNVNLFYLYGQKTYLPVVTSVYLYGTISGDNITFPVQTPNVDIISYHGSGKINASGDLALQIFQEIDGYDFSPDFSTIYHYTVFANHVIDLKKL